MDHDIRDAPASAANTDLISGAQFDLSHDITVINNSRRFLHQTPPRRSQLAPLQPLLPSKKYEIHGHHREEASAYQAVFLLNSSPQEPE
jgi:hypothetical protein